MLASPPWSESIIERIIEERDTQKARIFLRELTASEEDKRDNALWSFFKLPSPYSSLVALAETAKGEATTDHLPESDGAAFWRGILTMSQSIAIARHAAICHRCKRRLMQSPVRASSMQEMDGAASALATHLARWHRQSHPHSLAGSLRSGEGVDKPRPTSVAALSRSFRTCLATPKRLMLTVAVACATVLIIAVPAVGLIPGSNTFVLTVQQRPRARHLGAREDEVQALCQHDMLLLRGRLQAVLDSEVNARNTVRGPCSISLQRTTLLGAVECRADSIDLQEEYVLTESRDYSFNCLFRRLAWRHAAAISRALMPLRKD